MLSSVFLFSPTHICQGFTKEQSRVEEQLFSGLLLCLLGRVLIFSWDDQMGTIRHWTWTGQRRRNQRLELETQAPKNSFKPLRSAQTGINSVTGIKIMLAHALHSPSLPFLYCSSVGVWEGGLSAEKERIPSNLLLFLSALYSRPTQVTLLVYSCDRLGRRQHHFIVILHKCKET